MNYFVCASCSKNITNNTGFFRKYDNTFCSDHCCLKIDVKFKKNYKILRDNGNIFFTDGNCHISLHYFVPFL